MGSHGAVLSVMLLTQVERYKKLVQTLSIEGGAPISELQKRLQQVTRASLFWVRWKVV